MRLPPPPHSPPTPHLSALGAPARHALASFLVPVELTPGQELALPGDEADGLWVLHEGEVQVGGGGGGRDGWCALGVRHKTRTLFAPHSINPPHPPTHQPPPTQVLEDCEVVGVVEGPTLVGADALLQHCDPAYALRRHGYRWGALPRVGGVGGGVGGWLALAWALQMHIGSPNQLAPPPPHTHTHPHPPTHPHTTHPAGPAPPAPCGSSPSTTPLPSWLGTLT